MIAETVVRRNDPCPCGSGKKYKKCCINNEETQSNGLLRLLKQEFDRINQGLFTYSESRFKRTLSLHTQKVIHSYSLPYSLQATVKEYLMIWGIFNLPVQNGQTPFELYTQAYKKGIDRQTAIDMVAEWKDAYFSVYSIHSISDEGIMALEDVWTHQSVTIPVPQENKRPSQDSLLVGMRVPILDGAEEFLLGYAEVEQKVWSQEKLTALREKYLSDDSRPFSEQLKNNLPNLFIELVSDVPVEGVGGQAEDVTTESSSTDVPKKGQASQATSVSKTEIAAKNLGRADVPTTDANSEGQTPPTGSKHEGDPSGTHPESETPINSGVTDFNFSGSASQREVLDLLLQQAHSDLKGSASLHTVVDIWRHYVEAYDPTVKKPEAFAAALDYLLGTQASIGASTQAEVSKKYGVSSSTVSKNYRLLQEFVAQDQRKHA